MRSLTHPEPTDPKAAFARTHSSALSIALHFVVVLAVVGVFAKTPQIAPYKLPGTAKGVSLLTYYSPGGTAKSSSDMPAKKAPEVAANSTSHSPILPPKPTKSVAPNTELGSGSASQSGLGEGDIRIALQRYFPYPKPDLSTLPHGSTGDVILDAVVDEHGNVSKLTLVKGLGPAIDNAVIATVKQWSYIPATKNGVPVPSEQELHFHYERG